MKVLGEQSLAKLVQLIDGRYTTSEQVASAISSGTAADSAKLGGTAASSYAKLASPTFTGTPKAPAISDLSTNTTQIATTAFVQSVAQDKADTAVANLVNSAPAALDTLNELAAALGNDPNFATTIATQIGGKADENHTHVGTDVTLTGYNKASSASAVAATDTVNAAIGKLEKALDGKQASGSYAAASHTHNNFVKSGSTAAAGFVPSPGTTAGTTKFLREDATWQVPAYYTHPTTAGYKHIPSGGSSGQILKYSASGTAVWADEYSYTHPTTAGNKHIPTGGSSGQVLVYGGSSGTAEWGTLASDTEFTTTEIETIWNTNIA